MLDKDINVLLKVQGRFEVDDKILIENEIYDLDVNVVATLDDKIDLRNLNEKVCLNNGGDRIIKKVV